jgi:diguanylate cyclase (GGDEF)-like protein
LACKICEHPANKSLIEAMTFFVSCHVCGDYRIDVMAETLCAHMEQERKWLLAALVREAHERGEQMLLKGNAPNDLTKDREFPSPPDRMIKLLRYVDAGSGPKREPLELDAATDYPVAFAAGPEDFRFLIQSLINRKLLERAGPSDRLFYRMTMLGYEQLARSQIKPSAPDRPTRPPDALTGLSDRGTFDGDLARAVAEAQQKGYPLALVSIDADHFKSVNDNHGHPKGDEVLRGLAERLQSAVLGKGTAYRVGGEEMAALLPNHSLNEALAVAERFRALVEGSPVAALFVTVSVGVAVLPDHAADGAALIATADAAMYDAKHRGRNLVRYHGEPELQADAPPTPRTTPRKQPSPDHVPDEWIEAARTAHFRDEVVRCPRDQAIMKAQRTSGFGEVGGVYFFCPSCGLSAQAEGRPVESP